MGTRSLTPVPPWVAMGAWRRGLRAGTVLAGVLALVRCGGEPTAPPAATQLAFTTQPADAVAGVPLAPVHVEIRDAAGARVGSSTAAVTLALGANPGAGVLAGPTTVNAVNGIATFSGLSIEKAAAGYTLTASAPTLAGATSTPFAISPGPAAQLAFTVQPPDTVDVNLELAPAVAVALRDAFGNSVPGMITVALGANPGAAVLAGRLTADAPSGVATFDDLRLDKTGAGFTLIASTAAVSGESEAFAVVFRLTFVSAGGNHTCGVARGGLAYCWGGNQFGAIGNVANIESHVPLPVSGGLRFATVSAGEYHTCGVTTSGAAYCWGWNEDGQLGAGSGDNTSPTPLPVSGGLTFETVSAGYFHTCGIAVGGAVYCWGSNAAGQLGDASLSGSNVPAPVPGAANFAVVTAGAGHTCGITTAEIAYCWGDNTFRQLGDSTNTQRDAPVPVWGDYRFAGLSAGSTHTCGRLAAQTDAYCWGAAVALGDTTDVFYGGEPVRVAGELAFGSVDAGGNFSCGLTTAGRAHCWGDNTAGKLGDGRDAGSITPVPVALGITFFQVTAGGSHACAVTPARAAYCWGSNTSGRLGDGTTVGSAVPVRVVDP